ncbi:hypothetical protein BS78_01G117700 [Paspalum vaginatum]|nr:hypothetical protein BS78_01G117700 [Paspalum vaginatum]
MPGSGRAARCATRRPGTWPLGAGADADPRPRDRVSFLSRPRIALSIGYINRNCERPSVRPFVVLFNTAPAHHQQPYPSSSCSLLLDPLPARRSSLQPAACVHVHGEEDGEDLSPVPGCPAGQRMGAPHGSRPTLLLSRGLRTHQQPVCVSSSYPRADGNAGRPAKPPLGREAVVRHSSGGRGGAGAVAPLPSRQLDPPGLRLRRARRHRRQPLHARQRAPRRPSRLPSPRR